MGILTAKGLAGEAPKREFMYMARRYGRCRRRTGAIAPPRFSAAVAAVAAVALLALDAAPALAQAGWFGKNKIQYRDLEWQILRTPHFDVHFTDGYRDLAARTGFVLEYGYEKLARDFSHQIGWRIPVIVYGSQSDFQQTNVTWSLLPEGVLGFSEPTRRRIVIYFGGSSSGYANTAVHELVHIFTFDIVYGNLLKSVFSRSRLFPVPLWFAEGLAEYYSVGWEASGDMFMRDAAVFDYLPDLEYAGGYMAYKAGQAGIRYINETYGPGKVVEILEGLRGGSLGSAIQNSLGITHAELSRDWKKSIRKRYWPLYADKKEPEAYGRRLTDHVKGHHYMNTKPAFSPDGEHLVYFSDRKGLDGIYLMNALTGKVVKRLVTGMMTSRFESIRSMNSSLTYSPAGDRIAFVAKSRGFDRLFIATIPRGRVVAELPLPLDFFHSPAWSPDGETIALVGVTRGQVDLYLYRIATAELARITDDAADESAPAWFPDGTRIAYARSTAPTIQPSFAADSAGVVRLADVDFAAAASIDSVDSDIWSVDWRTGEQRLLIRTPGEDGNPSILPGGEELLFTSDEIGSSNLYRGSVETGNYYRFTDVLGGVFSFSYSPAKDRLVMSAFSQAGYDLFMMDEFGRKSRESYSTGGPILAGNDNGLPAPHAADTAGFAGELADALPGEAPGDSIPAVFPADAEGGGDAVRVSGSIAAAGRFSGEPRARGMRDFDAGEVPPAVVVDEDSKDNIDPDTLEAIRQRVAKEVGSIQPYRLKLAPDYVGDMASVYFFSGYGFGLMNQIAFSDLLGDHHLFIAFNIFQSIEDSDVQISYYYLKKRIDYAVGIFQYKNYLNSRVSSVGETFQDYRLFTERNYGVSGLVSYPLSTFSRIDLGLEAFVSEREFFGVYRLDGGGYAYYVPEKSTRYVLQPGLSLVHDSAYWGYYGPVIGSRWLANVSKTVPLSDDMIDRVSAYYDFRKYQPLFHRNYLVFRSMGAASSGDDGRVFFLGGPMTVRGYDYLKFSGSRMMLFQLEYRYPLLDAVIFGWPGRWGIGNIGGSFFIDSGSVWGRDRYIEPPLQVEPRTLRGLDFYSDFGFGFHMRFGYIVLNFQWGWPTDFTSTGDSVFNFYLGPLF
jgi:Tol biopolymer transport system component